VGNTQKQPVLFADFLEQYEVTMTEGLGNNQQPLWLLPVQSALNKG